MEWHTKLALYLGVSLTLGAALLVTVFIAIRYLWQQKHKQKRTFKNGILGQIGISQHAPEFTIPLMIPLLIQDSLDSNEDPDASVDPVQRTRSRTWQGEPTLIQPQEEHKSGLNVEDGSGPMIRRLQSITDVSIFPDGKATEPGKDTLGPWMSGYRRESLFFPLMSRSMSERRSRTSTSSTAPTSPDQCVEKMQSNHESARRISEVSFTSCDNIFYSITADTKSGTSSDPEMGRKHSDPPRAKHTSLRKMISVPADSSTSKMRPQITKRFSETHRRRSSGSLSSMSSVAKPAKPLPSTKRGRIVLAMKYNEAERNFVVHLINATDLPMKNNNLLDSYARLCLAMPIKQHRQQSKVHKKTCNPIYDEEFVFEEIDLSELLQSTLRIKIMHSGFTRSDVIGEAVVFLSDEDVLTESTITKELLFRSSSGIPTEDAPGGELLVSVCHHATTAQLQVIVQSMKELPRSCKNPIISIELLHKGETVQKQQTRPKKSKKSCDYHEEFKFHIPTSSMCTLSSYSLQFSVFSQDILRGLICMGYVTLSEDAPFQSEVDHWKSVVCCPHKPISEWHKFHATPN